MPRRSLFVLLVTVVVSYVCYQRADHTPYGRYFSEVMDQIDQNYVEPVDNQKLFEGAVDGMVGRLDPYSGFTSREDTKSFQETLDQKFGGVGIEVALDQQTRQLTVMTPVAGTPAFKAGVRAGDKIVAIDGRGTEGFLLKDAVNLLRGEPGQPVVLRVLHEGETEPVDLEMQREIISVQAVLGDSREPDQSWNFFLAGHDGIGYLRIGTFGEQTASELRQAMDWLLNRNARGVILDLRNNPGGLLKSSREACDLFLPEGKDIVSTRGRDGRIRELYRSTGSGPYQKVPLVVLVNRLSASASEIMAACLQDNHRAVIVGERTWGKGTVQNVIPVEGGKSVLRLTVASYWRPNGHNIHKLQSSKDTDEWGVKPDDGFAVELDEKEIVQWMEARRSRDVIRPQSKPTDPTPAPLDPQLKKAVDHLERVVQPEVQIEKG